MTNTSLYSLGAFNDSLSPVLLVTGFVQIFASKIQGFFQTFFQNKNFFFPDSRLSNRVINKDLKKHRNKAFLWCAAIVRARLNIRFDQIEKEIYF